MRRFLHRLREIWHILREARFGELLRLPFRRERLLLNAGPAEAGSVETLARLGRRLQGEVFTSDGRVDYGRLTGSPTYRELEGQSRALAAPAGTDAERTAFLINLYNVLTIHGIVALGIRRSVMEIPTFFVRVSYRVGAHELSLDEIEGLLRRNRPSPASGKRLFADDDPRLALAPATVDGRIHGALVCAAQSCPPIALYQADRLDAQLDVAAANLAGASVIDDARRIVTAPAVFLWYDEDFGGVVPFLRKHGPPALAAALDAGYRVRYAPHAWALNAAGRGA